MGIAEILAKMDDSQDERTVRGRKALKAVICRSVFRAVYADGVNHEFETRADAEEYCKSFGHIAQIHEIPVFKYVVIMEEDNG
jgi:hypothetical protein